MTTIAYRDGVLAADSKVTDGGCYVGSVQKVFRAEDGTIGALAGCLGDNGIFRDWLLSGREGPCELKDQGSEGIFVTPDGKIWNVYHGGKVFEITGSAFYAHGSGFRIALGAMAAGASAEAAVRICCDLDDSTREPIRVERLGYKP
mgnify:CR=1 FL=1